MEGEKRNTGARESIRARKSRILDTTGSLGSHGHQNKREPCDEVPLFVQKVVSSISTAVVWVSRLHARDIYDHGIALEGHRVSDGKGNEIKGVPTIKKVVLVYYKPLQLPRP